MDWYWVRGQLVELYIVVLHGKRRKAGCARLGLGKPNLPQGWAVPAEAQPYVVQGLPGRVQQGRSQDYREAENVTGGDSSPRLLFTWARSRFSFLGLHQANQYVRMWPGLSLDTRGSFLIVPLASL